MRKISLFLLFSIVLLGVAPAAVMAQPSNYLAVKGGYFSPSKSFDLDNVHFSFRDGFAVEGALGHYFLPFLAVEVGGGYLESNTSASLPPATAKVKIYPVVATGKLLLPFGPIEPYGEFGVGAYIIDLQLSGTPGNFSGSTQGTFGYHAGGGMNFNFGPFFFLGAEGRYLWAERSFGATNIKLDGFTVTGNLGLRF